MGQRLRRQSGLNHFLFPSSFLADSLILRPIQKIPKNAEIPKWSLEGSVPTYGVPVVAGTFRLLLQSRFEGCPGRECHKQSHQFFEVYGVFGLELKVLFHPLPEVLYKMPMLQMPTWSVPTHLKGDVLSLKRLFFETYQPCLKGFVVLPFLGKLKGN